MEAYFQQFGAIKKLRIARNKLTRKSKHFSFIEFGNPQVRTLVEHNKLVEKIIKQDKK
ncbi:hypothetical protein REPUB_Repub05bG0096800 [Reevesia pubescens]